MFKLKKKKKNKCELVHMIASEDSTKARRTIKEFYPCCVGAPPSAKQ
jgi:hypothetical protein